MSHGAILSDCGDYRYTLHRSGDLLASDGSDPMLFVMLNPSTADHEEDDNTIKRCRSFSSAWGFSGISVVNLFAYRSTDPRNLCKVEDPVGPENDYYIGKLANSATEIICAWGDEAPSKRVLEVYEILANSGARLSCLNKNKSGMPRHPLYVPGDQERMPWSVDDL